MSGELLLRRPYTGSLFEAAPPQSFQHDLESILWILLWISFCQCGAGTRRPALTDRTHAWHDLLEECVGQLFEAQDNKQLGNNKWDIMMNARSFEQRLEIVDDLYAPLKPLLQTLWRTLNAGYVARRFDFGCTMDEFLAAFDEAERELEENPPILTPLQEANVRAEEVRRAKDDDDWEHTPCPGAKQADVVPEPRQAQQRRPSAPKAAVKKKRAKKPAPHANSSAIAAPAATASTLVLPRKAPAARPFGSNTAQRKVREGKDAETATRHGGRDTGALGRGGQHHGRGRASGEGAKGGKSSDVSTRKTR